ncbi:MAG: aminotransferase class III-fold pyridoxal phosphate-dependent enzyme [Flavobacteriales bacterium]
MLEPDTRLASVDSNFLQQVQRVCRKYGAVFILDEMITGFRWHFNGAMHLYEVEPDLATFGKGMANGFAQAALIGRREIMELGGIRNEGAERVFLISSTHGCEMSAFGAFLAASKVAERDRVCDHMWAYGRKLMEGMHELAKEAGVEEGFRMHGFACSPYFTTFDRSGAPSLALRTLWAQEMVEQGVLMSYVTLSLAHGDRELERTLEAARKAFRIYARAWEEGTEGYLEGPVVKPVFRQFN